MSLDNYMTKDYFKQIEIFYVKSRLPVIKHTVNVQGVTVTQSRTVSQSQQTGSILHCVALKKCGVHDPELVSIYTMLKYHQLLEHAVLVFHSSLTIDQANRLECVQKLACKITIGQRFSGFPRSSLHSQILHSIKEALSCMLHYTAPRSE